jgi:hypothetical protein
MANKKRLQPTLLGRKPECSERRDAYELPLPLRQREPFLRIHALTAFVRPAHQKARDGGFLPSTRRIARGDGQRVRRWGP